MVLKLLLLLFDWLIDWLSVLQEEGGKTKEEADKFLTQMQDQGRYSTDVWF